MADSKVEDMTDEAVPTGDDLLYIIQDPGGTPLDRKATITNVLAVNGGLAPFAIAIKSAIQTVNNTITLVNVTDIVFAASANKNYSFDVNLFGAGEINVDMKISFAIPSGADLKITRGLIRGDAMDGVNAAATSWKVDFNGNIPKACQFKGYVDMGSTAGDIQMQFSQFTANVSDLELFKGCNLIAWKEV